MSYEKKIEELKLHIPPASKPVGSYRPVILAGNLAFLSGQISRKADGMILVGKVGKDLTLDEAREAARIAAINVIGLIRNAIGFERFRRLLRVVGYVQTAPDFYDISKVVDAASDLFLEVFGEAGAHVRSAVGMASLPLNAAVEIEVTLEILS